VSLYYKTQLSSHLVAQHSRIQYIAELPDNGQFYRNATKFSTD